MASKNLLDWHSSIDRYFVVLMQSEHKSDTYWIVRMEDNAAYGHIIEDAEANQRFAEELIHAGAKVISLEEYKKLFTRNMVKIIPHFINSTKTTHQNLNECTTPACRSPSVRARNPNVC